MHNIPINEVSDINFNKTQQPNMNELLEKQNILLEKQNSILEEIKKGTNKQ